ncbi:hypothetical protein A3F32_02835 [Candidatus Roizmanbacteria bacterium RIFCSPHIGHO2_12_FULL_42_10]|uniref:Uncharacterized protein n=1 Tax=Candidatus Roizmanbacteria bacterium RIFCSPHIGHO2_12_FULL_42_10 TaxID=1802053 RepID=A0A1F7I2S0_9BACT|nr:MAG: hypothetical protein A3F32_02835 [Candidatus Roizmanbacteria bacterium RIFCSPHIGHO2_12_FULL_42_10]
MQPKKKEPGDFEALGGFDLEKDRVDVLRVLAYRYEDHDEDLQNRVHVMFLEVHQHPYKKYTTSNF